MSDYNILTPDGWIRGQLQHRDGRVTSISGVPCDPAGQRPALLLPGFIDLHVHGGGGSDVMEGAESFATIARTHLRFGTTSMLATTMTAPAAEISQRARSK
jgi:N-acetylglucosamine-6-phosphate deacetylase